MLKFILILSLATSVVSYFLTGCAAPALPPNPSPAEEPVSVKLGWTHSTQFLGFYIAQERGYYAEEGLAVTLEPLLELSETTQVADQVAGGMHDFGVSSLSTLGRGHSPAVTVVGAIYQLSPMAFFARAETGIRSPADLAGHSVAVKTTGWRLMLIDLLDHAGLTLADIDPVEAGFDMSPFINGEIDVWAGFLTNEVVKARRAGLELVTLPLYDYGIRRNDNLIYTSSSRLATTPALSERFLRATVRGWQWAIDHPDEAVEIMITLYPELADDPQFHLASFNASIPLILPGRVPLGYVDCKILKDNLADSPADTTIRCTNQTLESILESE